MSGVEVVAVVACVAAVISAYQDGSKVFQDIKKKWRERRSSHPQAASATDLDFSLQRSREDILTQWNGHVGRLGHRFEVGDEIAQATMKDILIGLQLALLTHLRENGVHLDIFALLNVSDLSRARTISALHELYQRLAQQAPIPWHMTSPVAPGLPYIEPGSGIARYIGVIETLSSSQPPPEQISYSTSGTGGRPNTYYSSSPFYSPYYSPSGAVNPQGQVLPGSISSSPPEMSTHRPSVDAISPRERRASAFSSISSTFSTWLRDRRRSSTESNERDEIAAISGLPSPPPTSHQEAFINTEASAPRPIPQPTRAELDAPLENEILRENPWMSVIEERVQLEQELQDTQPQRHRHHNYQTDIQSQSQTHPQTPHRDSTHGFLTPPLTRQSNPIPTTNLNPNPTPRATPSIHSDISNDSGSSNRSSEITLLQLNPRISLWPPNRNNDYAGFCKGAWKQNSGFEGFKVHSVPIGYYSLVPKWKCVNCFFDMPMASASASNSGSGSSSSGSARFDEKVYTHSASKIRYRWSFLAKSHIASKTRPVPSTAGGGAGSVAAAKIGTFGLPFSPTSSNDYYPTINYDNSGTISPSNTWTSQSPQLFTEFPNSQIQHTEPTTCKVPTNPNTNANATALNENFQRYNCPPETQNYDSPDMTDEELELYWKMLKDTEITTLSDQLSYPVPSNVDISNPDHQREQCGSTDCNPNPQDERCRLHRGSGTGDDEGSSGTRIPGYDLYMSSFFM
ncbi:hypothetical protein PENSTE_c017G00680 [Penicillium steckii]|uniref:Prion-inhibition and propagation HeLo domain-containing protein n=1 Tax=Penicillium steckii TaxID=303698 RepID=A0A1V6SXT1_9EURO|nr:hypothetical protein PENSTE_c017G00680 [Penicillium steckii]